MHILNPLQELKLADMVKKYLSSDVDRTKTAVGNDGRLYIISCGMDDGDVSVSVFMDEQDLAVEIDKQIESYLDDGYGTENNADEWLPDIVDNAVYSGRLVRVALWG